MTTVTVNITLDLTGGVNAGSIGTTFNAHMFLLHVNCELPQQVNQKNYLMHLFLSVYNLYAIWFCVSL